MRESGVEWTLLRASWFCQNFSESYLLEPLLAGEVALPVGHVGEPFVDADDIADVAVAALTEEGHAGQLYEVTGPAIADVRRGDRRNRPCDAAGNPLRRALDRGYAAALESAQVPPEFVRS